MLVLTRHKGQSIIMRFRDAEILVKLIDISRSGAQIGIEAPKSVLILRKEIGGR